MKLLSGKLMLSTGLIVGSILSVIGVTPAQAQSASTTPTTPASSTQGSANSSLLADTLIAQAPIQNPTAIPTDLTPSALGQERRYQYSQLKYKLFQSLPDRLWFNASTEVSQRLETNVFFQRHPHRGDYVFRTLPNVTLGWNVFGNTSVYCNYFVIKDVFAVHHLLTQPTVQSVSLGFQQNIPISKRLNLVADFQSRELWQARHLRQADLLPNISASYVVNNKCVLFSSALLQLRGGKYFTGATREIDPFFTVGALLRRGRWNFISSSTYDINFRNKNAIPPKGNQLIICDFELNRPVSPKIPSLVTFVRAEPIWNWGAGNRIGLSGFDFRLFGGIRLAFSKPSFGNQVNQLRQQLIETEQEQGKPAVPAEPKSN